jgi:hypothetical protein
MECKKFLEEFIEIYCEQPCLWQVKSKDYSNKNKKKRQLRITAKQITGSPTRCHYRRIEKKINNIRTAFRRELKKVSDIIIYRFLQSYRICFNCRYRNQNVQGQEQTMFMNRPYGTTT